MIPSVVLALWSGALYAACGHWAAALGGPEVAPPLRFGFGAAVSLLLTWAPGRGRVRWPVAVVAVVSGAALLALPPHLYLHALARFAETGGDLPPAAGRLLATLLAWGAGLVLCAARLGWCLAGEALRPASESPATGWRSWALGLACLYAGLTVWNAQIQTLTGDEPHYLLAARSLLRDGDADLTNDYRQQLFRPFYPSDLLRRSWSLPAPELDPHDVQGLHGERRPVHQLGLSLLLVPGFAVAGRAGGQATALLLGLLAALLTIRLCRTVGAGAGWGIVAATLLSPLLVFCASVHAEPAGAVGIAWLMCLAVQKTVTSRERFLAAVAAGLLAWLHLKFLPLAALSVLWLTLDGWRRREPGWWWPAAGLAIGIGSQLWLFSQWFGSWSPNAPQVRSAGKFPGAFSGSLVSGVPGLLVDPQDGLFAVWPVGVLALPGALLAWPDRRLRRLLAAIGLHLLLIATYQLWRSGFAPGGRQLLPLVPLLAPLVGLGAVRVASWRPAVWRWLVALNAGPLLLAAWLPRLRYPFEAADGLPRTLLTAKLHGPLGSLMLPPIGSHPLATVAGWLYLGALVALAAEVAQRDTTARGSVA